VLVVLQPGCKEDLTEGHEGREAGGVIFGEDPDDQRAGFVVRGGGIAAMGVYEELVRVAEVVDDIPGSGEGLTTTSSGHQVANTAEGGGGRVGQGVEKGLPEVRGVVLAEEPADLVGKGLDERELVLRRGDVSLSGFVRRHGSLRCRVAIGVCGIFFLGEVGLKGRLLGEIGFQGIEAFGSVDPDSVVAGGAGLGGSNEVVVADIAGSKKAGVS
jgi:hypothetical protein